MIYAFGNKLVASWSRHSEHCVTCSKLNVFNLHTCLKIRLSMKLETSLLLLFIFIIYVLHRHKNASFDLHTSNQFFLPWI